MSFDDALPPVVTCARCRRPECPGCEPDPRRVEVASVAWEGAGSWSRRLWKTSLDASIDPESTFGCLTDGKLTSAILFACVAESVAVGSLGALTILVAFAWAPAFMGRALADPAARRLGGEVFVAAVVSLLALHAVWGLCLEAGNAVSGGQPRWRLGVRFGLYACGWDLLTSPAGLAQGLVARGPKQILGPIGAATRAPRPAMRAYMVRNREFDTRAQRRATFISWSVLAVTLLLLVIGALAFVIRVALAGG